MYCVPIVELAQRTDCVVTWGGREVKKQHLISLLQKALECSWNLITMVVRGLGYRKGI